MQIRKNTKAFKTILHLFTECQSLPNRDELIRLYITKAGHTIKDRIQVEGIQGDAALFYEMNYNTVLESLRSSNHQLNQSDDVPGIYYFQSSTMKGWDQTPFEFDEAILKKFGSLPELPATRKKDKATKFVLPTSPTPKTKTSPPTKKGKEVKITPLKVVGKEPKGPNYKLKHAIDFTDLETISFRHGRVSKHDVLDYYNHMADAILPYMKDRPMWTRAQGDGDAMLIEEVLEENERDPLPGWLHTATVAKGKAQQEHILCNTKEELLYYVEKGCLEFSPGLSRTKSIGLPDYLVIRIDSSDFARTIEVMLAAKVILDGLKLPSGVKTDGGSGFHIHIPLDGKSKFETSRQSAELICKLTGLKVPTLTSLNLAADDVYGKVLLDYSANTGDKSVISPYSLVAGQAPVVATPLLWEEVNAELRMEEFTLEQTIKRLKEVGDPFEVLGRKKVNGEELIQRLEENYSFLV